jgi:hypothetical protein
MYDVYNICIIYLLPNVGFDSVLSVGDQRMCGYSADGNHFSPDLSEYFDLVPFFIDMLSRKMF